VRWKIFHNYFEVFAVFFVDGVRCIGIEDDFCGLNWIEIDLVRDMVWIFQR
jgi:hypothetical protein